MTWHNKALSLSPEMLLHSSPDYTLFIQQIQTQSTYIYACIVCCSPFVWRQRQSLHLKILSWCPQRQREFVFNGTVINNWCIVPELLRTLMDLPERDYDASHKCINLEKKQLPVSTNSRSCWILHEVLSCRSSASGKFFHHAYRLKCNHICSCLYSCFS